MCTRCPVQQGFECWNVGIVIVRNSSVHLDLFMGPRHDGMMA